MGVGVVAYGHDYTYTYMEGDCVRVFAVSTLGYVYVARDVCVHACVRSRRCGHVLMRGALECTGECVIASDVRVAHVMRGRGNAERPPKRVLRWALLCGLLALGGLLFLGEYFCEVLICEGCHVRRD